MFGSSKPKVQSRKKNWKGNDVVVRKHGGIFGKRIRSEYKKDWLGRSVVVKRKAHWWE